MHKIRNILGMNLWCVVENGKVCNYNGHEVHGHGVGIQVWSCDVLYRVEKCAIVVVLKFLIITTEDLLVDLRKYQWVIKCMWLCPWWHVMSKNIKLWCVVESWRVCNYSGFGVFHYSNLKIWWSIQENIIDL